jgi:hypothetical protein
VASRKEWTMTRVSDAALPSSVVANHFEPLGSHDVLLVTLLNLPDATVLPADPAYEKRELAARRVLDEYNRLTSAEQAAAMLLDQFRFRIGPYQRAVRAALKVVLGDLSLAAIYGSAFPGVGDGAEVPSPLHGAVLAILADGAITRDEHQLLAGAWDMVVRAKRADQWSRIEWPEEPTPERIRVIVAELRGT